MSDFKLEELAKQQKMILLAEIGALLHDIGKLSHQFIEQASKEGFSDPAGFEHENALIKITDFVNQIFINTLKSPKLKPLLHIDSIGNNEQVGQLLDLIIHHDKSKHPAFLVKIINKCDGFDSGADKGTAKGKDLPRECKQPYLQTFISSAFGYESDESLIDPLKLDVLRQELSLKTGDLINKFIYGTSIKEVYRWIIENVKSSFISGLGETRRPANDVTLWDHSFSTATFYKSCLTGFLLNGELNYQWRLLRINFDELGLYSKAVKISDLLGYRSVIDKACWEVKQLIEIDYPLGNEVYHDTTGIYFTFPDRALPIELEQKIRRTFEEIEPEITPIIEVGPVESLKKILAQAKKDARKKLAWPVSSENFNPSWQSRWDDLSGGKWELCPICRLRPMDEGSEGCKTCLERRKSRIETWMENPSQTVWMDEIADVNGRVALIAGKFGLDDWLSGDLVQTLLVQAAEKEPDNCIPKNPSPARLRRIWKTTERFWNGLEKQVLNKTLQPLERRELIPDVPLSPGEPPEGIVCDGMINGRPISVMRFGDRFRTVSYFHFSIEELSAQTLPLKLSISWGEGKGKKQREFKIRQIVKAPEKYLYYFPSLTLLASPDRYLALVPASAALEVARKIYARYREQFGKVQNRLPLFLGLVFFPRKLPLTAVMDTARRLLEQVDLSEATWRIESASHPVPGGKWQICFKNKITWEIPVMMDHSQTDDIWYPYFFYNGAFDPLQAKYSFQLKDDGNKYKGRWLVHVKDLMEDAPVDLFPSRFAYVFLEHTARRFAFDPKDVKNVMLLDELPKLCKMWRDICMTKDMTDTKLCSIQALFEAKRREWALDDEAHEDESRRETFLNLVKSTFWRENITLDPLLALDGSFQYCLELYLNILKKKVAEEKLKDNEEHSCSKQK